MSIREFLRNVSKKTGIPFEVLRGRYSRVKKYFPNKQITELDLTDNYHDYLKTPLTGGSLLAKQLGMDVSVISRRLKKGLKGLDLVSRKIPKNASPEEKQKIRIQNIRKLRLYGNNQIPVTTLGRAVDDNATRSKLAYEIKRRRQNNETLQSILDWRNKKLKEIQNDYKDNGGVMPYVPDVTVQHFTPYGFRGHSLSFY